MARRVNLDELGLEPIEVVLGGKVFHLPADIPVPSMLYFLDLEDQLKELAGDESDEQLDYTETVREMYTEMLDLFLQDDRNKELLLVGEPEEGAEPEYRLDISLSQIPVLFTQVNQLYTVPDEPEAKPDADRPTRPKRTRSGTSSARSGSRKRPAKRRAASTAS